MGTLRALIDQASGYAEALFKPDDVMMPHFVAEAADGALVVAALAMGGLDLDLYREALALQFRREGHRRWVFFAEGWHVEYAGGARRGDPEDHPERMEVVFFDAFDAAGSRRVRASRQVLRQDERTARLLPLVIARLPVVDVPTRSSRAAR